MPMQKLFEPLCLRAVTQHCSCVGQPRFPKGVKQALGTVDGAVNMFTKARAALYCVFNPSHVCDRVVGQPSRTRGLTSTSSASHSFFRAIKCEPSQTRCQPGRRRWFSWDE